MSNCYYIIIANKTDIDYPSYISIWQEQYSIQANIFDAYKFTKKETAEIAKTKAIGIFKHHDIDIIEINKQIFGKEPRFVEKEPEVYVVMSGCSGNCFPSNIFTTEELAKDWLDKNKKNLHSPYIDAWTVFSDTENIEPYQGQKN